jgi:hypothetical protein
MKFRSVPDLIENNVWKVKLWKTKINAHFIQRFSLCLTDKCASVRNNICYCTNLIEHINILCGQSAEFLILNLTIPTVTTGPWRVVPAIFINLLFHGLFPKTQVQVMQSRVEGQPLNKWIGKGVDTKRSDVLKGTIPEGLITCHSISSETDGIRAKN